MATVRAVVHEAGHETVAAHFRCYPDDHGVRYIDPPNPLHCAADVECLPLADVLAVGSESAGHLHRSVGSRTPSTAAGSTRGSAHPTPADGSPGLAALAALVAAQVTRDLLDVRLAKAQHEVDDLRIAAGLCETDAVRGSGRAAG